MYPLIDSNTLWSKIQVFPMERWHEEGVEGRGRGRGKVGGGIRKFSTWIRDLFSSSTSWEWKQRRRRNWMNLDVSSFTFFNLSRIKFRRHGEGGERKMKRGGKKWREERKKKEWRKKKTWNWPKKIENESQFLFLLAFGRKWKFALRGRLFSKQW